MDYILGIDIGTSSSKALAWSLKGTMLAQAQEGYPTEHPQPGYSEQRPAKVLDAVLKVMRQVIQKQGNPPLGISFSAAMHSIMAVDSKGNPLTPLLLWSDSRSQQEAMQLRKQKKEAALIYRHTGTPIHAMSPLCKLLWWKENQPALLKKATRFISIKEYVLQQLLGEYVIDHSLASATGLFDHKTLKWYAPALNRAGITPEKLSTPVRSMEIIKGVRPIYQKMLRLDKETPFIAGASDGCLANLGSGAIRPGELAVTIGTSGAVRMVSSKPAANSRSGLFSYLLTEKEYVVGGAVNNGGILLDWYTRQIDEDTPGKEEYNDFIKTALSAPAGSEALLFLPYLQGERSPMWDGRARGAFVGIDIRHNRAHFMRAILEGICYSLKGLCQSVGNEVHSIKEVYASGGFTHSPDWVQMLSDMLGSRIQIRGSADASSIGAAMMGGVALGIWKDWEETVKFIPATKTFSPKKEAKAVYARNFELFSKMYETLKPSMHQLADWQKEEAD